MTQQTMPPSVREKYTEELLETVCEWFYQQVGGDPEDLWSEIEDQISGEIEHALSLVSVKVPQ